MVSSGGAPVTNYVIVKYKMYVEEMEKKNNSWYHI